MFIQIINVRHLECSFLLVLVAVMSWLHEVREVRVKLELMVLHTLTKFHLDLIHRILDASSAHLDSAFHPKSVPSLTP
jgi:hypothetical protein